MKNKVTINCPQTESSGQEEKYFDDWLNSKEAANYLSVSYAQLRNLTSNGRIPYYKFGRSNRFKKSELQKVLEQEPRGVRNGN